MGSNGLFRECFLTLWLNPLRSWASARMQRRCCSCTVNRPAVGSEAALHGSRQQHDGSLLILENYHSWRVCDSVCVALNTHLIMKCIIMSFYIYNQKVLRSVSWYFKPLFPLFKFMIPLDTQFQSDGTWHTSTCLPATLPGWDFVLL